MISSISSSDNKRSIILACASGAVWGGKEVYNTRQELLINKASFKIIMKDIFYNKENIDLEKQDFDRQLKNAKKLGKNFFNLENQSINKYYQNIQNLKNDTKQKFKQKIKTIKKQAPLKITLKTLGGAVIGLGISFLFNYIKNRTKK